VNKTFTTTVGSGGQLTIDFEPGTANNPKIDAIEIQPGSGGSSGSGSTTGTTASSSGTGSSSGGSSTGTSSSSGSSGTAFGVKISGSKFVSTQTGNDVQFLGVSISGLEEGASALNTSAGGYGAATDPGFAAMASWNINLIRIPLNEDTWLGIHGCITDSGSATTLQNNLQQIVANANANGIYVILDLHWMAPSSFGCPVGQGAMLDSDNSANFWTSVASAFKGNPAVMFEMMNEPFGTNDYANWIEPIGSAAPSGQSATDLGILLNGGTYDNGYTYQCNSNCPSGETMGNVYTVTPASAFTTAGMQQVLNAIRATGATNVVLSNPIGWAGEIQTWLGAQPTDPAHQLAAGWHEDGGGSSTTAAAQAILAAGYPIIITEAYNDGAAATGALDPAGVSYFSWAMTNEVGYSYWAWVPWSGGILSDTTSYTPNALGTSLKNAYCGQPLVNASAQCN
jgi:hypothetical protein